MSIPEQRRAIRKLLDDTGIVDAPTAYYALYHDAARSALAVHASDDDQPMGFAGRFQTGHDLFRPLVTMRSRSAEIAADLMAELLTPGRPYIFFANLNQLPMVGGSLQIDNQRLLHITYLDVARFRHSVNVMVVEHPVEGGTPRFEIHSGGLQAVAGTNWVSPGFAEIYVYTEALARKRGWGRAVVLACVDYVLRQGRLPLFLVETNNEASRRLAETVGFVDSGARQIYADAVYLGHPAHPPTPAEDSVEQNAAREEGEG